MNRNQPMFNQSMPHDIILLLEADMESYRIKIDNLYVSQSAKLSELKKSNHILFNQLKKEYNLMLEHLTQDLENKYMQVAFEYENTNIDSIEYETLKCRLESTHIKIKKNETDLYISNLYQAIDLYKINADMALDEHKRIGDLYHNEIMHKIHSAFRDFT